VLPSQLLVLKVLRRDVYQLSFSSSISSSINQHASAFTHNFHFRFTATTLIHHLCSLVLHSFGRFFLLGFSGHKETHAPLDIDYLDKLLPPRTDCSFPALHVQLLYRTTPARHTEKETS
jgi:hypothetical protein